MSKKWEYVTCDNVQGGTLFSTSHYVLMGGRLLLIGLSSSRYWEKKHSGRAKLIAAAPEMYEALEKVLYEVSRTISPELREEIETTLRKARGEK